jgi:hypothetical protein
VNHPNSDPTSGASSSAPNLDTDAVATARRLPDALHRQLAGRDVGAECAAVEAFVRHGAIPTDSFECLDVASWCLQQDLPEHFRQLPVKYVFVTPPVDLRTVADCLARSPGVEILAFERCAIGDDDATRIAASLASLPALADLRFDSCTASRAGLEAMSQAPRGLKFFEIDGMPIGPAMPALALALRNNPLRELVLSRAGIDDGALETLCTSLKEIATLKILNVFANKFSDGTPLAELVVARPSLTSLMLGKCPPRATVALLGVLRDNHCHVERLAMTRIATAADGQARQWFDGVAAMLESNRTLSTLDLSDNSLAPHSLQRLGEAVAGNVALRELHLVLANGSLSESNMDSFIDRLKQNFTLTTLRVDHWFSQSQHLAIETLMRRNQSRAVHGSTGDSHGQHSQEWLDELSALLKAGNHEGISKLCRTLGTEGATLLPAHMDGLLEIAVDTGRLMALLRTFQESGMRINTTPGKHASWIAPPSEPDPDAPT